ncbi:hypothetical protein [Streptomyces malaysiensis]|uniref:Uncharacterized protein n=1 Tax=Streptomyces malaysiensis subsp. samsunensis TaxID=459658 RepID=A0A9X2RXG4_STRMQ|nr:hypothetical protein [Streptomyces samsunensis]MCQ8831809.1 hypothetical protein [Streptomyces samsunensis]
MFGIGAVQQAVDKLKTSVEGLQTTLTNAIKQGLADIKTTIDQIGGAAQRTSESAGAISRKVDNLHTEIQTLHTDIEHLRASVTTTGAAADDRLLREIADLRATIEGWRADLAEARHAAQSPPAAPAETLDATTRNGESNEQKYREHLTQAASISSAEITCHRDMWNFLVKHAVNGDLFRLPGKTTEQADGRISVHTSGPTLTAALEALWALQHEAATPPGVQALARVFYQRIGEALAKAKPAATEPTRRDETAESNQPGLPLTRIVIDDRPPVGASN